MADFDNGGSPTPPGISEASFYKLLKDRIFVDYFNVFLSLPVFSQRVFYKYATEDFEFDPPLQLSTPNARLDKSRILNWLYETRLPPFLKTDIYLEYKLCKQLLRNFSKMASKDKPKLTDCRTGEDEVEDVIGHVLGMRQFRKYLSEGPGSRLLRLWLDVERFLRLAPDDRLTRWMSYRELQVTFCDFDRRPSCPGNDDDDDDTTPKDDDTSCVVLDGQGFIEVDSFSTVPSPTLSKRAVDRFLIETYSVSREDLSSDRHPSAQIPVENLKTLQDILVQVLGDYWLPKFLIHRQTLDWLQSNVKRRRAIKLGGGLDDKEKEDKQIPAGNFVQEMKKNMTEKSPSAKRRPKDSVVDNSFLRSREANEVLTMRPDGSVTLGPIDPTVSTRVKMTAAVRQAVETYLPQSQVESERLQVSDSASTFSMSSTGSSRAPSSAAMGSDCAASPAVSASLAGSPAPSVSPFPRPIGAFR